MREINFAKSIGELRKREGVTQEEMADALHISSQAVSKWETGANQPDTLTLAAIADYFHVSIDYLFYGETVVYDDIYARVTDKVAAHPKMSEGSYKEALKLFAAAHHGISGRSLMEGDKFLYDTPAHISNENGLSLLSGKGYGAIVTRDFFSAVTEETLSFAEKLLQALAQPHALLVLAAVIGMSDISLFELKEKLPQLEETELEAALEKLVADGILKETISKHKALGKTYMVAEFYHTCLCILLATLEMQRYSFRGIACCMSSGDYPIRLGTGEAPA